METILISDAELLTLASLLSRFFGTSFLGSFVSVALGGAAG